MLRHSIYNFIGLGAPLLVAVVAIPPLIDNLGADRFGLLTLIWAVVGYFGLFDLGLGRALTVQLAVAIASRQTERIGSLVGTASCLLAGLGVIAGLVIAIAAPAGVKAIPASTDTAETLHAAYGMAVAMPAIVLTSGFRGILEARYAFGIINLIRLPLGLFTFLGPLAAVLAFGPRLDYVAYVLAIGRVVACTAYAYYAWSVMPSASGRLEWRSDLVRPLCVSGGWMTLSNVVSPLMGYIDRFAVGTMASARAVTYYVTPQELATKLWILPGAVTSVLFPTFASHRVQDSSQTWPLFERAVWGLFAIVFPVTLTMAVFAEEILAEWIGQEFSKHSGPLLKIFAFGILINCLAHVPFTLIQSRGDPKVVAIIHLAQLPFFVCLLWVMTSTIGVVGAALAWLARMAIDTLLMFYFAGRVAGKRIGDLAGGWSLVMGCLVLLTFATAGSESVWLRSTAVATACLPGIVSATACGLRRRR